MAPRQPRPRACRRWPARDARVTLVSGQGNVGFRAGREPRRPQGRAANCLIFLNPDAFLQPGCVAGLVREIEGRPVPSLVGGRVLNADRTEQRGGRRGDITPVSALLSLSSLARRVPGWRRFEVHWEQDAGPDEVSAVPTVSGACFVHAPRGFRRGVGLRRGLLPARRGRRPVLAGAPEGRRGAVPPQGRGHPHRRHQPDQPPEGGVPQGRRTRPVSSAAARRPSVSTWRRGCCRP